MRIRVLVTLMVCCFFIMLIGASAVAAETSGLSSSPFNFCLWPDICVPGGKDINGLNCGFVTFGNGDGVVSGVDAALFLSTTENVNGVQMSLVNITKDSNALALAVFGNSSAINFSGCQMSMANSITDSDGVFQLGCLNSSEKSKKVFQLGLINFTENSKCFQMGLLNMNDKGFLPVFPFFNFVP